ncbi:MAG: iron uptake transporter permease EfeU [Solirubrobacteraceae bacterium]
MTPLATLPIVHFVIGLREGVEAALVVGIIATFLYQQRRADAVRWMWAGVALAVAICVAVAVVLQIVDEQLPQRQQEAFEAAVGVVAVAMVTWMIVYMRRHARRLGGDLRTSAASALAAGSAVSLVVMAFLAVMREGLETAMFLLAAFQASMGVSPLSAGLGAVAGLLVAAAIGWAIYRAGMRVNMARFFKITSVLLVIIAAGLLSSAVHHANEAALVTVGHEQALDLSAVIVPSSDSVTTGLITGLLGLYPYPSVAEVVVWLAYAIPMLVYVLWPQRRSQRDSRRSPAPLEVT